jgi:hypothetical protein
LVKATALRIQIMLNFSWESFSFVN